MKKKRNEQIDLLRAISIIGVILIHTFNYNLTNPLTIFFWNYTQFVVAGFVFCSGYSLTAAYSNFDKPSMLGWYRKRITRLVFPFYLYFFVHMFLWLMFPDNFMGLGLATSWEFIWKSLLLVGGVNINWIPLLFLELTILFPLMLMILKKKIYTILYIFFSLTTMIIFTITPFYKDYYRYVMWIPWSFVLLLSIYCSKKDRESDSLEIIKRYVHVGITGVTLFSLLLIFSRESLMSINLRDHKYPPDIFYLSYSIGMTYLIFLLGFLPIVRNKYIEKIFIFISKNSYPLFFVLFIFLDFSLVLAKKGLITSDAYVQFPFVLVGSFFITFCINKVTSFLYARLK